jgi:hypothetical protein
MMRDDDDESWWWMIFQIFFWHSDYSRAQLILLVIGDTICQIYKMHSKSGASKSKWRRWPPIFPCKNTDKSMPAWLDFGVYVRTYVVLLLQLWWWKA